MSRADGGLPRWAVVSALGVFQIFAWGSTIYLMTVLAQPIAADTGWPLPWVVGALSSGLVVAGLASPRVGATIARRGGRPVLAAAAILIAAGLAVVAAAPNLGVFYLGWAVIGLGMAAGLYDPAFATLGRLYGRDARAAITALTLWGGFASTVCWPLSAVLLDALGWRGTALAYAAINLFGLTSLALRLVPDAEPMPAADPSRAAGEGRLAPPDRTSFLLVAAILVLAGAIAANVAVHLLTFLQAQGHSLAAAVGLGALFGPAQVGARVVEMASGGRHHPIWTLSIALGSVSLGLLLLAADAALPGLALILFGAGSGLLSIARGALPLAMFGAERYAGVMGRLARPALIAQAIAPMLGAALIAAVGPGATLWVMAALALVAGALSAALWRHLGVG